MNQSEQIDSEKINEFQASVLIGNVLGDGHIQQVQSKTKRCRLRNEHSYKQKEFLDWKYSVFKDHCSHPPKYDPKRDTYSFYTYYLDSLKTYHELFYEKVNSESSDAGPRETRRYRKRICPQLQEIFSDPISLMVWYLDDGSRREDCNACRIATHNFSLSEIKILQSILAENFQLPTHIVKAGRSKASHYQWYVLSISARDGGFKKLRNLIYDPIQTFVPSMLYKIDNKFQRPRND